MKKIAILRGEEVAPEPVAVVVEEVEEFEPFKERVKYGVRASVGCVCGRKVTVGIACRCGRKG